MHVVVIDDQSRLAELVTSYLIESGATATGCLNGEDGIAAIRRENPDAVVLDLMLPGMDGNDVCRELRAEHNDVPIIMLTARGEIEQRVLGFDSGADDYLVKPFALEELMARLRAAVRRRDMTHNRLFAGDLKLDFDTRRINVAGEEITPSRREFTLLAALMNHPGEVRTREHLEGEVWDAGADLNSNALEVHISRVRSHLKGSANTRITTVRGVGYRLDVER